MGQFRFATGQGRLRGSHSRHPEFLRRSRRGGVKNAIAALQRLPMRSSGLSTPYPKQIAGIILEPVAGNMGCVPPVTGFLQGLRDIATRAGSLLIFDEVMTGFRVARGGAQAHYDVTPDITTLGKVIGGGLPIGAFGGAAKYMDIVAPAGPGLSSRHALGQPSGGGLPESPH